MAKKEYIEPTRKEKSEWKKYLYNALMFLATERPEFRPRKRDSLETLKESFFYWADEYNDGYFSEQDDADTDRYCAWLVQEHLMATDIKKFYAEYLIKGATLLSADEAEKVPEDIRKLEGWWWLRSPGSITDRAAYVNYYGRVSEGGDYVNAVNNSVRPALQLSDISNLKDRDKINVGGYEFDIVCGGKYALCTKSIGNSVFRNDRTTNDANVYEASDVKKIVDEWYETEIKGQECHIAEAVKKKFVVTFSRVGYAEIEARSIDDAYAKAEGYGTEDVEWADSFEATDAEELAG